MRVTLSSIRIVFLIRIPQSAIRNQTCGGFEAARTNATATRARRRVPDHKKTRKLNAARGGRAGTNVATGGGRGAGEGVARGGGRGPPALQKRHPKTDHLPFKEDLKRQ